MATVDKNFRIKHGLVVEGTTATVNGQNVLTETGSDQYILDLVGGANLIDSVASGLDITDTVLSIDRTVVDTWYDANGAAATAQSNAEDYADGLASNYDPAGAAATAQSNAEDYADGLASNYDPAGAAATAQSNAEDYADGLASNYEAAGAVSTHAGLTSTHGVTGDIVGTTDTQDISNKRIIDTLYFTDGVTVNNEGEIAVRAVSHDFDVQANYGDLHLKTTATGADVQITSQDGDILLNADGKAYYGSASAENEIATHSYVDNAVAGLDWKNAAHVLYDAATPVLTATYSTTPLTVDGHLFGSAEDGLRVLITSGNDGGSDAGIYVYNHGTTWTLTRATDADAYTELLGAAIYIAEGTQYGGTSWVQNNPYLTDFSAQSWTQFSGAGSVTAGSGITVDGLEVSIDRTTVDDWYEASGAVSTHSGLDTGVHGVTGDVVGTSDSQTLTNKTIDGGDNTLQNIPNAALDNDSVTINGQTLALGSSLTLKSSDIGEDQNLYFTDVRAKTSAASLLTGATKTNIVITGDENGLTITAENGVADSDTDDLDEGSTNLYFTDARAQDAVDGTDRSFTSVELNSEAKQFAATSTSLGSVPVTAYQWAKADYRSAKVLVKINNGTHNEISEILLTLDSADNVAITEYAIVGTNGSRGTITADVSGSNVRIRVNPVNDSTIKVTGTLLK